MERQKLYAAAVRYTLATFQSSGKYRETIVRPRVEVYKFCNSVYKPEKDG